MPLLIVVALILSACGGGTSHTAPAGTADMNHGSSASTTTTGGTATMQDAPIDRQFIDMMVPHHQGAVEMAKIAQTRAEHPEIKTLAGNIIASQTNEIGQMKQWRAMWFGSDQTPPMDQMPMMPGMSMSGMHMDMMADITTLQTASPFDKAFLQAMIPHHQSAIDAAKIAQKQGQHPELMQLATSIITDQQKEIDQMQSWLKTWYP